MSSLLIDQPGESVFHDPTEITQWIPKEPPATGPRGDVPLGGKYNNQIKELEKLYSPAGQGVDRFRVQSGNDLTIAQHASPYLPFQPIPFIPDDEPLDDDYHGPVFYEEEDGQGAFDWVQELFIDPNNMYADASDLTNTLEPFQNPRSGSLRHMSDEERINLLGLGVEAHKA